MADSLLPEVLPAHSAAGELSSHTSEKPASLLKTSNTEELSEAADTGSSRSYQNQLPIDTYCRSQQSEQNLRFTSEDGCSLYNEESTRTALEESVAVVHPEIETECGEEGDVCEGCGRSKSEGRKMLQLEKDVQRLEEALKEREQTIASLLEENIQKTAELLEIQLQKLQRSISEKDSAIAMLEMRQSSEEMSPEGLEKLRGERGKLTQQLKNKVQERVDLFRKDSDKALDRLANQFQTYNKKQVCEVLRALDRTCVKLKSYIDQLLAVVLESNPNLLEGMPRIQQNIGMKIELFRMASMQELIEELHEKEQNCQSLQNYAGLLLQRITEQSPNLLESISCHHEQCSELLMAEH